MQRPDPSSRSFKPILQADPSSRSFKPILQAALISAFLFGQLPEAKAEFIGPTDYPEASENSALLEVWNVPPALSFYDFISDYFWQTPAAMRFSIYAEPFAQTVDEPFALRLRGYITIPETGTYQFSEATTGQSILMVGADGTPFSKVPAVSQTPDVSPGLNAFSFEAGQKVYLEILQLQNEAGWVALDWAWTRPDGTHESIPSYLWESFTLRADDANDNGLPDDFEAANDIIPPVVSPEAGLYGWAGDFNHNGFVNLEEYQLGTSPTSGNPTNNNGNSGGTASPPVPTASIHNGTFAHTGSLSQSDNVGYDGNSFNWDYLPDDSVEGWEPVTGEKIEIWSSGGNTFCELAATTSDGGGIKQQIKDPKPGSGLLLTWNHRGRMHIDNKHNDYTVRIYSTDANGGDVQVIQENTFTGISTENWTQTGMGFTVPQGFASTPRQLWMSFISASTIGAGSLIDDVLLTSIDIEEVISDQIAGNEANKLPSPYFGGNPAKPENGYPNNPMLMATRTGSDARLMIKMNVHTAQASSIRVGVRETGQTNILNSVASVPPPGKTPLSFTALAGTKLYEVVAGYDANGNSVLEDSEVAVIFEKTPRKDKEGNTATANLHLVDKFRVVTQDDFNAARTTTDNHADGILVDWLDSAEGLLKAFARGSASVPGVPAATTTSGHLLLGSPSPSPQGLSHPVGGSWTTPANNTTTLQFEWPTGSDLSEDVVDSNGITAMIRRLLVKHKAALAASATSTESVVPLHSLSDDGINFRDTDKNDQVHVALGACRFEGGMEVKVKKGAGTSLEISEVNCWGALFDLYDWSYDAPRLELPWGTVIGEPREAAKVQAGFATLAASTSWPSAGRVFFTKVNFGTGWKDLDVTIP